MLTECPDQRHEERHNWSMEDIAAIEQMAPDAWSSANDPGMDRPGRDMPSRRSRRAERARRNAGHSRAGWRVRLW